MAEFEPLRIVHCVRAPIGGIFRHVADLAVAQAEAGHTVGIVCDSTTGGLFEAEHIARIAPKLALGVTRLPMVRAVTPKDVVAAYRLYKVVSRMQPDVVHGHGSKGGTYSRMIATMMRLRGRHVARVYCPHGGSLHFDPATADGRFYLIVERMLENMTDGLVFVSEYEHDAYVRKIGRPSPPYVLAYNGLAEREYEPVVQEADPYDFLHIGMLRHIKGTDVFIRAMATLKQRGTAARALIVGVGDERPCFEALADEIDVADRVTFRDAMPIREALAKTNMVVVPSRAESMPYVVLETIAAGTPLIATRVGGIPEIYGEYANRLIEPGDVDVLADAMDRSLRCPAAIAVEAEQLRRAIRGTFAIETMTRSIDALYQQILRGHPKPGSAILPVEPMIPVDPRNHFPARVPWGP